MPSNASRDSRITPAAARSDIHALHSAAMTRAADQAAVAAGLSADVLMAQAGARVAETALDMWPQARFLVLCGPGNNGGDGYVAARRLRLAGRAVELFSDGAPSTAAAAAARTRCLATGLAARPLAEAAEAALGRRGRQGTVVVDALFGAGLARPLAAAAARLAEAFERERTAVLCVDIPSGVNGDNGSVAGAAFRGDVTVAFERARPGHFAGEGGRRTGRLSIRRIGMPQSILRSLDRTASVRQSHPAAWSLRLARPDADAHKYTHGHVLVHAGPPGRGGAARLAALAALAAGSGLVTVAAPPDAVAEHAARLDAVMLRRLSKPGRLGAMLADVRIRAAVIGPGAGAESRKAALAALEAAEARRSATCRLVLDADALTAFASDPDTLFARLAGVEAFLTPHRGEFSRLFPDLGQRLASGADSPLDAVRKAARRAGATVLLKGPCTVIGSVDGPLWLSAAVGEDATPWLATAGAGDVLAGCIAGLAAQGNGGAETAAAAAWLHARAARRFGPGLTADVLPGLLPAALRDAIALAPG